MDANKVAALIFFFAFLIGLLCDMYARQRDKYKQSKAYKHYQDTRKSKS